MSDPRTPVADERKLAVAIRDINARLDALEAPSGTQSYRAVERLQQTVAELATIVTGLEARLDAYLETEAPAFIDARVASQIAAILAGDVTIGGDLTVNGDSVTMIALRTTNVSSLGDRVVVWVAGDGTVGHT